jgi:predicted patatin/cPLA2 family phospholipase
MSRAESYNEELSYIDARVQAGAAFLIAPEKTLEIARLCHDPDKMQRVYEVGRDAGERNLSAVLEFLS